MITIVILILVQRCTSQFMPFRPITKPDGSPLCAVQTPVYQTPAYDAGVPPGQPGAVVCAFLGLQLSGDIDYVGFNYVTNGLSKECQFYNNPPTYCNTSIPGCRYYEVIK